jgi:hypothetical protein
MTMNPSNAITMLESMRRKKLSALESLEAVDPDRFAFLLAQVALEEEALEFALRIVREHDSRNDALKALSFVAKTTHQAHHEGEFPGCQKNTCRAALDAGAV